MSEHTDPFWACRAPVCRGFRIFLALIVILLDNVVGRSLGLAEMKHWQDEWYAAHPVVKEVPDKQAYWRGFVDGTQREYDFIMDAVQNAPSTKPSKGSRKPGKPKDTHCDSKQTWDYDCIQTWR